MYGSAVVQVPYYTTHAQCMLHPHITWGRIKRRECIETLLPSALARGFEWGIYSCNVRTYVSVTLRNVNLRSRPVRIYIGYSVHYTTGRTPRLGPSQRAESHSKKKQSVQVVHVRRDARSAQEIVTLSASPSSVQESAQEIPVVRNLETLGNCPLSCCATSHSLMCRTTPLTAQILHGQWPSPSLDK